MLIQEKWAKIVDVDVSMKLWEKVNIFRAEDQGEKDASGFRD